MTEPDKPQSQKTRAVYWGYWGAMIVMSVPFYFFTSSNLCWLSARIDFVPAVDASVACGDRQQMWMISAWLVICMVTYTALYFPLFGKLDGKHRLISDAPILSVIGYCLLTAFYSFPWTEAHLVRLFAPIVLYAWVLGCHIFPRRAARTG